MELKKSIQNCEDEHNRLMKILNFRFPHKFKKIGLIGAVLIFVFLIGYKFLGSNELLVKDLCRTIMLLFLLLASLSRDAVEDEYVNHLRSQSYVLAFICATAYSIVLPLISFVMDVIVSNIVDGNNVNFHDISAFQVMFMLVCFQLLFFETLKRLARAQ